MTFRLSSHTLHRHPQWNIYSGEELIFFRSVNGTETMSTWCIYDVMTFDFAHAICRQKRQNEEKDELFQFVSWEFIVQYISLHYLNIVFACIDAIAKRNCWNQTSRMIHSLFRFFLFSCVCPLILAIFPSFYRFLISFFLLVPFVLFHSRGWHFPNEKK